MHLAPRLASLVDQPDHEILPAGVAEILMERWSLTWDSSPKSDDATDDEKYRLVTQTGPAAFELSIETASARSVGWV